MNKIRNKRGITLVALIVTIVILIILAGITIAQITGNGLFNNAKTASDETKKNQATETMNLKITSAQINYYTARQELPSLQYLADTLCEDEDMEYVLTTSKRQASLEKIDTTNISSIYTKLKKYPYEFEINSSLQLASINGIKIANNTGNQNGDSNNRISSDVINKLVCSVEQDKSKYYIIINPEFKTEKNNDDIYFYVISLNGKVIGHTKELKYLIQENLDQSTSYQVSIIAIDNLSGIAKSNIAKFETAEYSYTKQILKYPALTKDGVYNVKYTCEMNEEYNYFEYDSEVECDGNGAALRLLYNKDRKDYFDFKNNYWANNGIFSVDKSAIGTKWCVDSTGGSPYIVTYGVDINDYTINPLTDGNNIPKLSQGYSSEITITEDMKYVSFWSGSGNFVASEIYLNTN